MAGLREFVFTNLALKIFDFFMHSLDMRLQIASLRALKFTVGTLEIFHLLVNRFYMRSHIGGSEELFVALGACIFNFITRAATLHQPPSCCSDCEKLRQLFAAALGTLDKLSHFQWSSVYICLRHRFTRFTTSSLLTTSLFIFLLNKFLCLYIRKAHSQVT